MINDAEYHVAAAETSAAVWAPSIDRLTAAALLAIIALLLIAAYFSPHVWHHGEAREGLVIQDIVNHHRWILPLRNGELPSKPILYHWIAASFALLFGLSDFAVRLPSVLGAALFVWATYSLVSFGTNRRTGLLAVGILASTFEFWDSGTEARVDMLFAALIAAALAGWYVWYRSRREAARGATYLAIALAVLAKGPAGAVLPGLVIFCFLLFQRDLPSLRKFFSWPWLLLVLTIDFGWYLAAFQRGGVAFWHKQIVYENVDRFFGAAEFQTQKNGGSQALWLVTRLFPWSLVLAVAVIRLIRGQGKDSFENFLHTWWATIFVFFFCAVGQRAVYLLPLYPAVAALAARECAVFLEGRQRAFAQLRPRFEGWVAAAFVIGVIDLSFGAALPIGRTIQEDSSDQEEFFEEIIPKISRPSVLYAAPDFPETALKVLAYRLNRDIQSQPLNCLGDYYYLVREIPKNPCSSLTPITVSRDRKQTLLLLRVSSNSPKGTPLDDP